MSSQNIQLYITKSHDCSYIDGQQSKNLVPDPNLPMNLEIYSQLIQLGYRRSGDLVYRPHCAKCQSCIPCRVPVKHFTVRKTQRRCIARNNDLSINITPAHYSDEHFDLYQRYLSARHADGDMVNPDVDDYKNFLYCHWSNTHFIEFRLEGELKAVAVTDKVNNGLSSVYSFFDTSQPERSLGNYCVLTQIDHALSLGLDYLYLGYWIDQNKKMQYKTDFRPTEVLLDNQWALL